MFSSRLAPVTASPMARARARLGLAAADKISTDALAAAFRRAALAVHPDRPGGDPDRFRAVVEAYRLLQRMDAASSPVAPTSMTPTRRAVAPASDTGLRWATVEIDPLTAVRGGVAGLAVAGRGRQVRIPAGVRHGDRLRLMLRGGEVMLATIRVAAGGGLRLVGNDLHQDVLIHPRKLAEGGRFTIETHAGPRDLWLTRVRPAPLRYMLRDLGLPSLNGRPVGRLIIRLIPSAAEPTPAESMLDRFEADWAAPLAA